MPHAHADTTIDRLRASGRRLTRVRKAVVAALSGATPHTADEIRRMVAHAVPSVHKTTVYRELEALASEGLLAEVRLGGRAVRYELGGDHHHHHLVCTRCGAVRDVELEGDLSKEEARIARTTGFKVQKHTLEFFGTCRDCR